MAPDLQPTEPTVIQIDAWRSEFHWQGNPLLFDHRQQTIMRGGRVFAKYSDVQAVDIRLIRVNSGDRHGYMSLSDRWDVCFKLGMFSHPVIGMTHDEVEASIAAARVAGIFGATVRAP